MARTKDKVVIGFVHPTEVSAYFMTSLLGTALHDLSPYGGVRIAGLENRFSSANISGARNGIVEAFLANYSAEWLLFVDADMYFPPESLEGILRHAHHEDAPIVGGLCFGIDNGRLFPTLYDLVELPNGTRGVLRRNVYDDDSLTRVAATGAAFLLIHRRVLTEVRDREFNPVYPWFQETELYGKPCSEDFTFCLRAGLAGFPVHVDTGVKIGHHKSMVLDHAMFQSQRAAMLAAVEEAPDGAAVAG